MKLLLSQCILCTPYNHAPCHFMQSHMHKAHVCSAVTCHMQFWTVWSTVTTILRCGVQSPHSSGVEYSHHTPQVWSTVTTLLRCGVQSPHSSGMEYSHHTPQVWSTVTTLLRCGVQSPQSSGGTLDVFQICKNYC